MYIELPCRFSGKIPKLVLDEIEQEIALQEVLKGGDFNADAERTKLLEENKVVEYDNMVVDLSEVSSFNNVDEEHTYIRFSNGIPLTTRIPYKIFLALFEEVTGNVVKQIKIDDGKE